jgi:uncharacterized protein HemX
MREQLKTAAKAGTILAVQASLVTAGIVLVLAVAYFGIGDYLRLHAQAERGDQAFQFIAQQQQRAQQQAPPKPPQPPTKEHP